MPLDRPTQQSPRGVEAVESLVGRALAMIFFVAGITRGKRVKALHPRGEVSDAVLRRHGSAESTGVGWLDESGSDPVLVRQSRSVGLPHPLPDVLGLALRVPVGEGGYGDILLATTGTGTLGRFLLRLTRHPEQAAYSSLFPYRTTAGPLLLAAFPRSNRVGHFDMAWARPAGTWHPFATLEPCDTPQDRRADAAISFDPVVNVIPGLEPYGWSQRLREYSYAASRRARDRS